MTNRYAWVTIIGKVFVPDEDVQALLASGHDEYYGIDVTTEGEAFELLAKRRIQEELFRNSDDPVKECDTVIDLSTLR